MKNKYCIIVDAYSSGNLIAPHLNKIGFQCIHVNSIPPKTAMEEEVRGSFIESDFLFKLDYRNDIDEIINAIKIYNPQFVIVGYHSGVQLADLIGTKLGVPSNNSETTENRMNKFKMHERLKQCGLAYISSYISNNLLDFIQAYQDIFSKGLVVVKPKNSAGSDSVCLCNNEDEVAAAFKEIIHKYNAMNYFNDEVLMQEYIEGAEYIVDAVSFQGEHIITDIWDVKRIKKKGFFVRDTLQLLPYKGEIQNALVKYTKDMLDALDFTFGLSHSEVFMTPNGPVLIELNPRIAGGHLTGFASHCCGVDAISYLAKIATSLVDKDIFNDNASGYDLIKHGCVVNLISEKQGIVKAYQNLDKIKELETFYEMDLFIKIGNEIMITKDKGDSLPGRVYLAHSDENQIKKDYETIRMIEDTIFLL